MDWKVLLTSFGVLFLAELGDKTQFAVVSLTGSTKSPLSVFLGASLALTIITGLAVLLGQGITKIAPPHILSRIMGSIFLIVGLWMIIKP